MKANDLHEKLLSSYCHAIFAKWLGDGRHLLISASGYERQTRERVTGRLALIMLYIRRAGCQSDRTVHRRALMQRRKPERETHASTNASQQIAGDDNRNLVFDIPRRQVATCKQGETMKIKKTCEVLLSSSRNL